LDDREGAKRPANIDELYGFLVVAEHE